MPPKLAAPVLAHEFGHRLRRWEDKTLQDEVLAHEMQAKILQELQERGQLPQNLMDLLPTVDPAVEAQAKKLIKEHQKTVEHWRNPEEDFTKYVGETRGYGVDTKDTKGLEIRDRRLMNEPEPLLTDFPKDKEEWTDEQKLDAKLYQDEVDTYTQQIKKFGW